MKRRTFLPMLASAAVLGPQMARAAMAPAGKLPFDRSGAKAIALTGATVHIGDGTVVEAGNVVLRGSRIVSVGSAAPPADAERIDATSMVVTPGFIGAETKLGLTEISMESSTSDTSRENADPIRAAYDVSTAINADSTVLAVQAVEGITSAAVSPSGGLIAGRSAWIDLTPGDHRGIVARPRIAMTMSMGQSYAGSRAATVAKLAEVFDDAAAYRSRKPAFERRQSRDLAAHRLDLEALGDVLDAKIPAFVGVQRASEILAALDFAERRKLRIVLVGASQAWKVAGEIASAKVPVVLRPTSNVPGGFDRLGARLDRAALLHDAGVEVVIARPGQAHNVRNIRQEAGIAISYGLDRGAAMRAVTSSVARAYGMEADYGTLAAGKVANVVVWNGDPFELSSWPQRVFIRGRQIPLRSRQTELRDRYLDLSKFD